MSAIPENGDCRDCGQKQLRIELLEKQLAALTEQRAIRLSRVQTDVAESILDSPDIQKDALDGVLDRCIVASEAQVWLHKLKLGTQYKDTHFAKQLNVGEGALSNTKNPNQRPIGNDKHLQLKKMVVARYRHAFSDLCGLMLSIMAIPLIHCRVRSLPGKPDELLLWGEMQVLQTAIFRYGWVPPEYASESSVAPSVVTPFTGDDGTELWRTEILNTFGTDALIFYFKFDEAARKLEREKRAHGRR